MKPMLAIAPDPKFPMQFPRYASAKIDGFRGLVKDGMLLTRKLLPLPNRYTQDLFGTDMLNGLDGELAVGPPNAKNLMQRCQSELTAEDGEPDVTFWVFDFWNQPAMPYEDRWELLLAGVHPDFYPRVKLLPQALVQNQQELDAFEETHVNAGFEGVITRAPDSPYKYGRSTAREQFMLKHKRWVTEEAVVIGFEQQFHNANTATTDELGHTKRSSHQENMVPVDAVGAFICMKPNGEETTASFKVSPGVLTAEQRREVWINRANYQGRVLTYKTFKQTGVKDLPRFNIFQAFRSPLDL